MYEDIFEAKKALENLNGFHVGGRYLIVLYYQPSKHIKADNTPAQVAQQPVNKQT